MYSDGIWRSEGTDPHIQRNLLPTLSGYKNKLNRKECSLNREWKTNYGAKRKWEVQTSGPYIK
jgi:hypothetical protein